MKISIDTQKFLKVLVNSGMAESEAKAVLYDLIMEGQGIDTAPPVAETVEPVAAQETKSQETDTYEDQTEIEAEPPKPKLRKPVRINFAQFGGPEEPIR